MDQYSVAERAIQQARSMDPLSQLRKSTGVAAFDAIFDCGRSAAGMTYKQNLKQIAEAQQITNQLRFYKEAERIKKATNSSFLRADEWRWIEAVRKAVVPFDPVADLIGAPGSTSALHKYRAFHLNSSLGILTQALAESTLLLRAADEWSNVQRILRTVQELQNERNDWASNGGDSFDLEDDETGSEIVAAVVPREIGTSLAEVAELLNAILTEVRSNRSDPKQTAIFWSVVFPCLYTSLLFLLAPVWDAYAKRAIERFDPVPITQQAREANKSMNLQAREFALTPMLLSELRFVNCKKKDLALRKNPRKNAATLPMKIPRGQPVQILETKDSWTRIRWTDSAQSFVIEGWVFTRYLNKFN